MHVYKSYLEAVAVSHMTRLSIDQLNSNLILEYSALVFCLCALGLLWFIMSY